MIENQSMFPIEITNLFDIRNVEKKLRYKSDQRKQKVTVDKFQILNWIIFFDNL